MTMTMALGKALFMGDTEGWYRQRHIDGKERGQYASD